MQEFRYADVMRMALISLNRRFDVLAKVMNWQLDMILATYTGRRNASVLWPQKIKERLKYVRIYVYHI